MLTVGDHLLYLRTLEEVQLQQLRHVLTEINTVQHAQQLPAHWGWGRGESAKSQLI